MRLSLRGSALPWDDPDGSSVFDLLPEASWLIGVAFFDATHVLRVRLWTPWWVVFGIVHRSPRKPAYDMHAIRDLSLALERSGAGTRLRGRLWSWVPWPCAQQACGPLRCLACGPIVVYLPARAGNRPARGPA